MSEYSLLKDKDREYWLDGFEGPVKSGMYYRSRIHIDIEEFEKKFDSKVVAIKMSTDCETNKAHWTIEFMTELTETEMKEITDETNRHK